LKMALRDTGTAASVAIVGGGINGLCTAYFLRKEGFRGPITIVERDPSHSRSSTLRSVAAIRVQFRLEANVRLSLFGSTFFASAQEVLGQDIGYQPTRYLLLGGPAAVDRMVEAHRIQTDAGADVELIPLDRLSQRFPWLRLDGLGVASVTRSGEGWIDPKRTVAALTAALDRADVDFVSQAAVRFAIESDAVSKLVLADGSRLQADVYVNAAGPHAGRLMDASGLSLPVEPRKRCAFVFEADGGPDNYPCLVDPTVAGRSIFSRPLDGRFLAVTSPDPAVDPATDDLGVDRYLFEDVIRPGLRKRVAGFAQVQLVDAWAGHYEVNTFDQNAVIGRHPQVQDLYLTCGFSGHGVMHAPGAARGLAELITTGSYTTLDLEPFSLKRIAAGEALDDMQPSEHRSVQSGV
jgi:FAD-dependent oxidoreductase domain-containing protein 1